MRWQTAVKTPGPETDAFLNELSDDRWMIRPITWVVSDGRIYCCITACQSPAYAKKRKKAGAVG